LIDDNIIEYEVMECPPTCIAAASIMCAFEGSQYHVEEWRRVMIENNILKIDFVIKKILL